MDYRDVEWKPRRSRKGYFLSGLIGVLVGAFFNGIRFSPMCLDRAAAPLAGSQLETSRHQMAL